MSIAVEYRARLPVDARAPGAARRLVRCLDGHLEREQCENLELLVTELVTNAVRHAGLSEDGWVALGVVMRPDYVHVEVSDPGHGFDPHVVATPGDEVRGSGWGLFLVDQMASRWGVHHDACTRVWFDLATTRVFA